MSKTTKLLLGIIFFALFIRIIILANSSLTFYSDDAIYASLARFLLEGDLAHFFHPTWQPLYPALSVIFYKVVGNWEAALRLVSVLSGVAIVIPLFILVRKFLSTIHALAFSAVITFFAPTLKLSLLPMSDMLATLFVISGITATVIAMGKRDGIQLPALAALLFGLGFLTRSEGTMFFFLTLAWVTLFLAHQILKEKAQIRKLLLLPLMTGVFLLTISPYLVATKTQLGQWTLSHKFSAQIKQEHAFQLRNGTTWSQEAVSVRSPNYNSEYFVGGVGFVMENQDWFVWWFQQKAKRWINLFKELFPVWAMPLMALGLLRELRKHPWSMGYIAFVMLTAIPVTIFSTPLVDSRYLLWTLPLFLLFFYLGVQVLFALFKAPHKLTATIAFLLTLTFPSFVTSAITHPETYAREMGKIHTRPEIRMAGAWIRQNSAGEIARIAMRHEGVEFYANGETIYIPQELALEEFIDYAKKNKVDYVVAWSDELAAETELSVLLEEKAKLASQGLTLRSYGLEEKVRFTEDNRTLVIYALEN